MALASVVRVVKCGSGGVVRVVKRGGDPVQEAVVLPMSRLTAGCMGIGRSGGGAYNTTEHREINTNCY